jgi:hypothetical protein
VTLALVVSLIAASAPLSFAQTNDADSAAAGGDPWPRTATVQGVTISISQPQLESSNGNLLDAHAAVTIKTSGTGATNYGSIWFTERTEVDKVNRIVTLSDFTLKKQNVPTVSDNGVAYAADGFMKVINTRADPSYVANTADDIFRDDDTRQIYVLVGGRSFTSPSLTNASWSYQPGTGLPRGLAMIPDYSPKADVLVSVPGTAQAPDFKPITGSTLTYAVNTKTPVIYSIPASSPIHYVTYVQIYGYAPTSVRGVHARLLRHRAHDRRSRRLRHGLLVSSTVSCSHEVSAAIAGAASMPAGGQDASAAGDSRIADSAGEDSAAGSVASGEAAADRMS